MNKFTSWKPKKKEDPKPKGKYFKLTLQLLLN